MKETVIFSSSDEDSIKLFLLDGCQLSIAVESLAKDKDDVAGHAVALTISKQTAIELMLLLSCVYGMTDGEISTVVSQTDMNNLGTIADKQDLSVSDLVGQWVVEKLHELGY